jgi:hypothetical protein
MKSLLTRRKIRSLYCRTSPGARRGDSSGGRITVEYSEDRGSVLPENRLRINGLPLKYEKYLPVREIKNSSSRSVLGTADPGTAEPGAYSHKYLSMTSGG